MVLPGDSILKVTGSELEITPSNPNASDSVAFQNICASLGENGCNVTKPELTSLAGKLNSAAVNADPLTAMKPVEQAPAPELVANQQQNMTLSNS